MIDAATMRVTFFTSNLSQPLNVSDDVLLYDYYQPLPDKLALDNCWSWKLVGNTLIQPDADKKQSETLSLVDHNRKEAIKFLKDKTSQAKLSLEFDPIVAQMLKTDQEFVQTLANVAGITIDDYLNLQLTLLSTYKTVEINKEYFLKQLTSATSNEEILKIRDTFANVTLTELQINNS